MKSCGASAIYAGRTELGAPAQVPLFLAAIIATPDVDANGKVLPCTP